MPALVRIGQKQLTTALFTKKSLQDPQFGPAQLLKITSPQGKSTLVWILVADFKTCTLLPVQRLLALNCFTSLRVPPPPSTPIINLWKPVKCVWYSQVFCVAFQYVVEGEFSTFASGLVTLVLCTNKADLQTHVLSRRPPPGPHRASCGAFACF